MSSTAEPVAFATACPLDQMFAATTSGGGVERGGGGPELAASVFCLSTQDVDPDVLFEMQRARGMGVVAWPARLRVRIHPRALHVWDDATTACLFRMSLRDPGFYAICSYLWLLLRHVTPITITAPSLAPPAAAVAPVVVVAA